MAKLRTGDGTRGCDMGPLVTGAHRDRVAGYVDAGVDEGAGLVVDGRGVASDGDADGFWLGPDPVRQRHARDVDLQRGDLRAGAVGGARRLRTTRPSR